MSIPQDQVPKVVSTADGVASQFSYSFYAPDPTNVFVASNGALVSSGWQAVKVSDSAGYVKFNVAPSSGTTLTIYRSTPMTQETDWQQGQAFYADTLTSAADKLTMIAQELRGGTVNVPGTVVTAHRATYADSATLAGSAASAGSASYAGYAINADMATSALYRGAFRVDLDPDDSPPYFQINGGKVCANGSMYDIPASSALYQGGNKTVYLVGSSAVGSAPVFSYTTTEPTSATGQFYAPIASYSGGVMTQMQMGNIVDTSWGTGGGGGGSGDVNYASSAGVANNLVASAAEQIVSASVSSSVTSMGALIGSVATIPNWGMSAHHSGASGTDIGNADFEISTATAKVLDHDAWIYAFAEFNATTVDERSAAAHVIVNGASFKVCSVYSVGESLSGAGGSIVIPVISGSTVSFNVSAGQNPSDFTTSTGCVGYYINDENN